VFFRAGRNSLHEQLLAQDPRRNWDCCVNWYLEGQPDGRAELHFTGGDNKFEGLVEFLRGSGSAGHYEYILALDDDLLFRPGDVSRYFDICRANALYLSQPALLWRSHFSHYLTLRNPVCRLRKVTFIEVMAPCFSRLALRELRETFLYTKSTYGIDWAWSAEAGGRRSFHMIDEIPMLHTRPIDRGQGAFYRKLREWGVDPDSDNASVFARYPDFAPVFKTCRTGHAAAAWVPRRTPAAVLPMAVWLLEAAKRAFSAYKRYRGRRTAGPPTGEAPARQ
jgi:hypothetical protein